MKNKKLTRIIVYTKFHESNILWIGDTIGFIFEKNITIKYVIWLANRKLAFI